MHLPADLPPLPPDFPANPLLVVLGGSHAYGTNTPDSDVDYRGVMAATPDMLVGVGSWDHQYECRDPDTLLYTLPKLVRLALAANPNILDVLFAPADVVLQSTPLGDELRAMAPRFLSKRVARTYLHYASGQMKRLRVQNAGSRHGVHQELMDRFHYDTKNGMHLVRLYRMGYEILTTGEVRVRRDDAEELLAIRNGAWSLRRIEEVAEEMDRRCLEAAERSKLPDEPEEEAVTRWLMVRQTEMLAGRLL